MRLRLLIGAAGVALGLYGALLLRDLGLPNFVQAAKWLAGGVVLHDAVLAPLVIALSVLLARLVRGRVPVPVIVGALVLSSVTVTAIPVLGRFGALEDNPSLLPRNYLLGWLVFAALVSISVTVALLVGRRAARGGGHGAGAGR